MATITDLEYDYWHAWSAYEIADMCGHFELGLSCMELAKKNAAQALIDAGGCPEFAIARCMDEAKNAKPFERDDVPF